ncbi:Pimeloyl-ACP methyl ester carboxylesterase [Chitinophaga rupis]|uniref:Pimeloyl-ACP methyl ester carboxylesterase n=1 Tax=Chitinophaga rupis TaxID=573321 RepID=A0A1H8B204_9BACT|nr:alpha/beta fold hydrolase [Chitinophaga rupis]SEM77012.1 Pimeloyl-ACP methyl ester carboxylesterase [Chitinophaga rupis]
MKKTVVSLLSTAAALSIAAACIHDEKNPVAAPQTYVLVHGAWQAPYVWDSVQADLSKSGNKVIVVELPGHGSDTTPPHQLSLDVYRDKVIDAISKADSNVILVGHSMGGMVITQVAEKIPSKIRKLVYIGAFLPSSGQALTDLSFSDPGSRLGPLLIPSADQLTLDVKRDSLTYLFIDDGSETAKQQVLKNYRAEPAIPFTGKVTLSRENFGAVEKVYIKTLQDKVISPGLQDRMIAGAGIKTVYSLNTSHSPFLSQPHELSGLLLKIGKQQEPDPLNKVVARLIRYDVQPEFQATFRQAVSDYVFHSLQSETNVLSEAYHEQGDTTVLWLIERWSNKDELDKASKSSGFKAIGSLSHSSLKQPAKMIYVKDLAPLSKQQWRRGAQKEDQPLTIMLFVDAKPGTENNFKEVYHNAMPQFRGEPGVINYQLSQLEEDNTQFVTYEKFRNEDAFKYHLNFPPIQPVIDYLHTSIKKQPFETGLHRLIEFAPVIRQ